MTFPKHTKSTPRYYQTCLDFINPLNAIVPHQHKNLVHICYSGIERVKQQTWHYSIIKISFWRYSYSYCQLRVITILVHILTPHREHHQNHGSIPEPHPSGAPCAQTSIQVKEQVFQCVKVISVTPKMISVTPTTISLTPKKIISITPESER